MESKIQNPTHSFREADLVVQLIQEPQIHTFTYQKTLLYTLFCLSLKSPKAFGVSLSPISSISIHSNITY